MTPIVALQGVTQWSFRLPAYQRSSKVWTAVRMHRVNQSPWTWTSTFELVPVRGLSRLEPPRMESR